MKLRPQAGMGSRWLIGLIALSVLGAVGVTVLLLQRGQTPAAPATQSGSPTRARVAALPRPSLTPMITLIPGEAAIPPSPRAMATATAPSTATATVPPATATASPSLTATSTPTVTPTASPTAIPPTATPTPRRVCAGAVPPCPPSALLPGTLLIADSRNNRLIEVNAAKRIVWAFPRPGDLLPGQAFVDPDDAFFTPNGQQIITNQEEAQTLGRIDYRSHRLVWQYGHLYIRGSAPGYLNEPDDAYQLANGQITVADIRNCRILFLSPKGKIVRQYGQTGVCLHNPPLTYASPNGDTPLPDGGMLVTEIGGSHVVRLNKRGTVVFDLTIPWVAYPSDAQLLRDGSVLLADYSSPGGIVRVSAQGALLWRYMPALASDLLSYPSLAIVLPNGLIAANDDWNHRVVLIDPVRQAIVWQYGVTGVPGSAPGYLDVPDGVDFRSAALPRR